MLDGGMRQCSSLEIDRRTHEDDESDLRITRRLRVFGRVGTMAECRRHDANLRSKTEFTLRSASSILRSQLKRAEKRTRKSASRAGEDFRRGYRGDPLAADGDRGTGDGEWRRVIPSRLTLLPYDFGRFARLLARRTADPEAGRGSVKTPEVQEEPPVGQVRLGDLRRVTPVSRVFGYDRGTPVDRYYIERFLARHAADIRGRVLEVGDDAYTRRFGGDRVAVRDVLHVKPGNPSATIVADLADGGQIPSDTFDCVILTQTLHLVYDVRAAIRTLHRILKPGGVLLATAPGITQRSADEWAASWYWAFTTLSVQRLFEEAFPPEHVSVKARGNVLAAVAFLHGLAAEELRRKELDERDSQYQLTITVRAVKPA
jgi:SAM-dependent methyltransferase